MKPDLYIHLGMPKTGSTAIQAFLFLNRDYLSSVGLEYPHITPGCMNQRSLADIFTHRKSDPTENNPLAPWHRLNAYKPKRGAVTLISEECLYWPLLRRNNFEFAREQLNNFNLKLIIYIRRQDYHLESSYRHKVTHGFWAPSMPFYLIAAKRNYYHQIQKFISYAGRENVIVRVHDSSRFEGGSIFKDILRAFELPWSDDLIINKKAVNPGAPGDLIRFMRQCNKEGLSEAENQKFNYAIRNAFRDKKLLLGMEDVPLMSGRVSDFINWRYSRSNRRLLRALKNGSVHYSCVNDSVPAFDTLFEDGLTESQITSMSEKDRIKTVSNEVLKYFLLALGGVDGSRADEINALKERADFLSEQGSVREKARLVHDIFSRSISH